MPEIRNHPEQELSTFFWFRPG